MDSEHYLVTEGKLIDMPAIARTVVKTVNSGVTAMKTGDINILDPEFNLRNIVSELQNAWMKLATQNKYQSRLSEIIFGVN